MGRQNVKNSGVDSRKTVVDFELTDKFRFTANFKISFVQADIYWVPFSPHPNFKIEL